jgi:hypothetical protein
LVCQRKQDLEGGSGERIEFSSWHSRQTIIVKRLYISALSYVKTIAVRKSQRSWPEPSSHPAPAKPAPCNPASSTALATP